MKQKKDKKIIKDEEHNSKENMAKIYTKDMLSSRGFSYATHQPLLESQMKTTKKKCISASINLEKSSVLFLQNLNHLKPHNTQNLHLPNFVTFKILNNLHHPPITDSYS
jgi:hypothetical protein